MSEEIKNVVPQEQPTPANEQIEDVKAPETTENIINETVEDKEESVVVENTVNEPVAESEVVAESEQESDETINQEEASEAASETVFDKDIDYNTLSLKELVDLFDQLLKCPSQQTIYKHAEAIKAAFYRVLKKEKIAIGFQSPAQPVVVSVDNTEAAQDAPEQENIISQNPFADLESGFKQLYAQYKSIRSSYIQETEKKKDENLTQKLAIIEDLKNLLEKQEDLNRTFPEFRALQAKWRSIGPIPQAKMEGVYDTYSHYVEMFYDYVKINKELRDLDFKKNLDSKISLCERAETLINEANVVEAFRKLQKLHEEWKEYGPVEKEHRESIWERFKAATSAINKKHQSYFDSQKDEQKENLAKKVALCEKVEQIAVEEIPDSNKWNACSKEIENIQKEWKTIGFASKKDNQKIYDRFRAACDKFYSSKREFYVDFKTQMQDNMTKKLALCEQAEALKDSTDWKKTSDLLINLQKQWKEIGPVSRKKSEQIWKRFRAACDSFFDNKDKHFGSQDKEFDNNLQAKLALIEQIKNYELESETADIQAMRDFQQQWNSIGFVPFKEKEKIQKAYNESMSEKFASLRFGERDNSRRRPSRDFKSYNRSSERQDRGPRGERDKLMQIFAKKEQEIATYENNIGFFSKSKNADALLEEINKKIAVAKEELAQIEIKIKDIESQIEG